MLLFETTRFILLLLKIIRLNLSHAKLIGIIFLKKKKKIYIYIYCCHYEGAYFN